MLQHVDFGDNRGRFPEPLKIQAERGTRAALREAAARENISIGEFVRKAIGERIADREAQDRGGPHAVARAG